MTEDFNNVVIATKDGTPIRVSDVGYAEDTFQRPTTAAWLGGAPAVVLDIRRAMGENTVAVIEGVRAKIQTLQRTLPKAVTLTVIRDDSKFIYASVESLEEHLIFGSLFAAVVVMFFIRNIRAVLIASLAIPASIIASFTLMRLMGFTLNNMTLLGITLAVGIVIDDAIVVLENIFRYIEEKGVTPYEAAIQGTREVALAVMATTLSLVVIFLPVAFMTGYARRFINPVRADDGVRRPGVDAGQLHARADAELALPEAGRRRSRPQDEGAGILPLAGHHLYAAGELGARSSRHHHRRLGRDVPAHLPAELDGRPRVRAQRGHGRVDGPLRYP